ncbi:hypothetical protein XELAEV_18004979mg [Xenopus laevis]|uniref:Uncharacterized protein n=1 Tax=Xenopus laevis TaxID=8355 RepID=A0A974DYJ7_XENLA|nr:hypothetical protein XELAEV_18004979mg [Xenopus laevis]
MAKNGNLLFQTQRFFVLFLGLLLADIPPYVIKGSGLFTHVDIILEVYKACGGIAWFFYDNWQQKMSVPRSIPWGSKDIGLWMLIPRQEDLPKKNLPKSITLLNKAEM